jgi:Nif-specific regulatory protein
MIKMSAAKPRNEKSLPGLQRELLEITTLYEISKATNSSLDLEAVMKRVLEILHDKMGMARGTLCLLNEETNEIIIEAARGLSEREKERGRYKLGEGITGRVVSAGEPILVKNVGEEPLFLNRTRARGDIKRANISFLCVPIKLEGKTIGALSVDRLFEQEVSFEEDLRLLTIISSMVAQAVRIHRMVEREKSRLQDENIRLKRELKKRFQPSNIVGQSKRMQDVYDTLELVSKTKATVLLRGESGTGKELIAHAIHYHSDRAEKPFIKVSCAALPETLLESELFGYEKGAFTGANTTKAGRFEMANGGTLFLDEIGDLSPATQVKLLRVLQEREFERLGGTQTLRVDIRLIAATNKDLEKEVKGARFREDLYYRLNVVPIMLPALRERREDIPLLVNYFLERASKENKKSVKYISDEAMEILMNYAWPGNVRELENAIERAVVLCKENTLTPELFPIPKDVEGPGLKEFNPEAPLGSLRGPLPDAVEKLEKGMIEEALQKTGGNQRKAAQLLGLTERMIGYKIKQYGLKTKLQS